MHSYTTKKGVLTQQMCVLDYCWIVCNVTIKCNKCIAIYARFGKTSVTKQSQTYSCLSVGKYVLLIYEIK